VPCLILPLLQRLVAFYKKEKQNDGWPLPFLWFLLPEKRKKVVGVAMLVTLFSTGLYAHQRFTWMGEDNANLVAKEYFVAGQPLSVLRQTLCGFLNPENCLLVPLNALQRIIYEKGTHHLPKEDGEIGVWEDLWFHYPYIKRMHVPYGTSKVKPSPKMRQLLDRVYASIEIMSTQPFADLEMERRYALFNLPRAAFYFSINNGYYTDRKIGSRRPMLKQTQYVSQVDQLYRWMVELKQRWISAGMYGTIKRDMPKVEVTRQLLAIHFGGDVIYSSIFHGGFSCSHPLIPEYLEIRRDFTDPESPDYVWGRLHERQKDQAELLYGMAIDSQSVSFNKYLLEKYCGLDVPGEERFYSSRDKAFSRKMIISRLKSGFKQEIELIEEEKHGD
jgi:hypothetical protein